jgi:hypothetical protein
MRHLQLVPPLADQTADTAPAETPVVPIRLLLALSGRCDCVECCAAALAERAGRPWVHPSLRTAPPALRAVR